MTYEECFEELQHQATRVACVLSVADRVNSAGFPVEPGTPDDPEGTVQVRLSARAVDEMARALLKAARYETKAPSPCPVRRLWERLDYRFRSVIMRIRQGGMR